MNKLVFLLPVTLAMALVGCGSDHTSTTSPSPVAVSFIARSVSNSGAPTLYTLNVAAKTSQKVNIPIPRDAEYVSSNADASKVVYCRDSSVTGTFEIFLMGLDGVEHQLTTKADACEPVFSPDGKTIAYASILPDDSATLIYTMAADGSNQRAVYAENDAGQFVPAFSVDGKSLLFYRNVLGIGNTETGSVFANRKSLWKTTADGVVMRGTQSSAIKPMVSVDTTPGYYTISLATNATPTLVLASSTGFPAVYSADGTKIFLTLYSTDGACDVYSTNANGTGLPTKLTSATFTSNEFDYAGAAISFGGTILYNYGSYNGTAGTLTWDIRQMNQDGSNSQVIRSSSTEADLLMDFFYTILS